jgi:hypothetical protein
MVARLEGRVLTAPFEFSSPFGAGEFSVWVIAAEPSLSRDDQNRISGELVRQGCRFAVCSGHDCSSWDDSIDYADYSRRPDPADDEGFVMTTWHEDESIEEIAEYFATCTSFDFYCAERWLVLGIGEASGALVELALAATQPELPAA